MRPIYCLSVAGLLLLTPIAAAAFDAPPVTFLSLSYAHQLLEGAEIAVTIQTVEPLYLFVEFEGRVAGVKVLGTAADAFEGSTKFPAGTHSYVFSWNDSRLPPFDEACVKFASHPFTQWARAVGCAPRSSLSILEG